MDYSDIYARSRCLPGEGTIRSAKKKERERERERDDPDASSAFAEFRYRRRTRSALALARSILCANLRGVAAAIVPGRRGWVGEIGQK
jgi:hypothetical protein